MSIVPDKKNGKLTGRFRVQVMVNYQLYRRRVDTIGEARTLEKEWLEAKASGLIPTPPPPERRTAIERPVEAPRSPVEVVAEHPPIKPSAMLSEARDEAWGNIWTGTHEKNSMGNLGVILELMGDVALDDVNTLWVMRLVKALKEQRKASDGTLNRYWATLSKFLQWAHKAELRNVAELPEYAKRKEKEGRIRWYTEEEEPQMLMLLPERSAKMVAFAILTGGRRTELLNLRPDCVFPDRIIFWGQRDDERTKSGKSRSVPLWTQEARDLAKWLVVDGNMPTHQNLRDDWEAMRAANDEWEADGEFVFHGCRHTFAVRAVDAGVPIRTLQILMGHETIEMTEKYGKVSGKALNSAMVQMFGEQELEAA